MAPTSSWKVAYKAAVLEPNSILLDNRISAAQEVMMQRLRELNGSQKNRGEIRAIQKAIRTLAVIKWERLGPAARIVPPSKSN